MNGKTFLEVVLESANELDLDKVTLQELESLSLPPIKILSARQIKQIRRKAKVS